MLCSTTPLRELVVEVADGSLAAAAAGRWLAMLGATLAAAGGGGRADVVVHTASGAPHRREALDVSITVPGGLAGLSELALAEELWARSGLASITWEEAPDGRRGAPCLPTTSLPQELAGATAALVAAAWAAGGDRRAGGAVQVDALEVLTLLPMQPVAAAQLPAGSTPRGGAVGAHVGGIVEASDGAVYLRLVEPVQWARLLAEVPGALVDGDSVLDDPGLLDRKAPRIDASLRAWAGALTTAELLAVARQLQVPVAPFVDPQRLAVDEHLVARGYADGRDADVRPPWLVDHRRPRTASWHPDLRPSGAQLLRGLRVLDLTWAWAGPFATTLLAELGADVVNIEWTPRPSNLRVQGPAVAGFGVDGGGWWSANQRGKRSVALDLKDDDARQAVLDLASGCDAVIENFSPGVVDRLGVGFDALVERNPNLVYVSMSAYGAAGPRASERGYGTHLYASAGYADLLRGPTGIRSQMGIPLGDPIAGLVAALALVGHLAGGDAVHLDASELEASCAVRGLALDDGHRAATAIASIADTLHDGHLVARGAWAPDRTPAMSGRGVLIARAPWRVDGERAPEPAGAPLLGADTRTALHECAGWDVRRIDRLVDRGVALVPSDEHPSSTGSATNPPITNRGKP